MHSSISSPAASLDRPIHEARRPGGTTMGRIPKWAVALSVTLSLVACQDSPQAVSEPVALGLAGGPRTIVVTSSAELVTALAPENTGRGVLIRAGTYAIDAPLTVPDGVTLEGEGIMLVEGGLPVGFAPGTRTTLNMTANVPGNMLTLGDKVTIRGLEIVDLAGRPGNAVAVVSRDPGDRVSALIAESEIFNPSPTGLGPAGPTGYGLVVLTQNLNLGADPAAHEGAALTARMERSLIRSPGGGGSLFAFNFAAFGSVSLTLEDNILGGIVTAVGGVSRPDAVHDSRVDVDSHRNLYRDDSPDPCTAPTLGWNLTGGAGPPAPLPVPETARNTLRWHSVDDRVEGFTRAILATAARRFFPLPLAGPSTDNSLDLQLLGTTISTPSCGGAGFVEDLRLEGAFAADDALFPGDGNRLHAVLRGVTGSGPRFNRYADAAGPSGPLPVALQGDNRLEIVGSPEAFARTNRRVDPPPPARHFVGGSN